jgi:hypothetical protein
MCVMWARVVRVGMINGAAVKGSGGTEIVGMGGWT